VYYVHDRPCLAGQQKTKPCDITCSAVATLLRTALLPLLLSCLLRHHAWHAVAACS
jgi:hypothetical protein